MRCFTAVLTLIGVLIVPVRMVQAGIVGTTGSVSLMGAPADVRNHMLVSDTQIVAFAEQQGVVLPQNLTFNITQPGTAPGADDIGTSLGDIPAGTRIDSYLAHFESISGTQSNPVLLSGSITFESDVLGIAVFDRRLNESDPFLGALSTLYPTENRELEIRAGGIVGVSGNDSITLSEDRRTVTFNLGNTGGPDQARIVVAAVPEPSSILLAGFGFMCLAAWRLRRRRVR